MKETEIRRFKSLMMEKGFDSVVKLARAMGIRRQTLSGKINGRTDWSRTDMETVGKLFNEDPKIIFFED